MNKIEDQTLVLRLQSGDLEALGTLYDRHRQLVYRTALGITHDPEDAADLLQDVFLRLHRFCDHIDPARPLPPWLYRMTTNLSYTRMKSRTRLYRCLKELAQTLVIERKPSPLNVVEQGEQWNWMRKGLAAIPIRQRAVVVLYYINDLSLQEISEILEIPVGTVKSRLHYGRQALRRRLGLNKEMGQEVQYEFS